jgi:hypothetical protein
MMSGASTPPLLLFKRQIRLFCTAVSRPLLAQHPLAPFKPLTRIHRYHGRDRGQIARGVQDHRALRLRYAHISG